MSWHQCYRDADEYITALHRIACVVGMDFEDLYEDGKIAWFYKDFSTNSSQSETFMRWTAESGPFPLN